LQAASAALRKPLTFSSVVTLRASSVFIFETTDNITKSPLRRATMKYSEMRDPSESSQEAIP
jgi:hypothetical protein